MREILHRGASVYSDAPFLSKVIKNGHWGACSQGLKSPALPTLAQIAANVSLEPDTAIVILCCALAARAMRLNRKTSCCRATDQLTIGGSAAWIRRRIYGSRDEVSVRSDSATSRFRSPAELRPLTRFVHDLHTRKHKHFCFRRAVSPILPSVDKC